MIAPKLSKSTGKRFEYKLGKCGMEVRDENKINKKNVIQKIDLFFIVSFQENVSFVSEPFWRLSQ